MANQLNIPQLKTTDDLEKIIQKQELVNQQLAAKIIKDKAALLEKLDELEARVKKLES